VFADPNRDESLIIELLEFKSDVADNESAVWFLHDLASEEDAEGTLVCRHFIMISSYYQILEVLHCNWYMEIEFYEVHPILCVDKEDLWIELVIPTVGVLSEYLIILLFYLTVSFPVKKICFRCLVDLVS